MKVLIIGLGSIGKKHINALKIIDSTTEIWALRSNKKVEDYKGVINIFSLNELNGLALDFAIVSNPTSEHKRTIEQLIELKVPLFIEKPLHNSLGFTETLNLINENKIITYVACNLRFLDCIRYIKTQLKHLKDKRINEVNVYCGSYLPEWRPGVDYKSTYSAIPELGGGVHLDLIHELDYLYWLFGNPVAVNRTYRNSSTLGIAAFDYANYLMDYDRFCANVILNYFRKEPKRSMEIVFADETWEIDLLRNQVVCNNKILFTSHQRIADTYIPQIKYFIDCINSKSKTMNTVNDAFNVLKICIES